MKLVELLNIIHPSQDIYVFWRNGIGEQTLLFTGLLKDIKNKFNNRNIVEVWSSFAILYIEVKEE